MKKKVVALLTLAMFVMTLLPVAAFAATEATPENSYVEFEYEDPTVDVNEVVKVTAYTYADEEQQDDKPLKDVRVYLKDANGKVVKNATIGKFDVDGNITPAKQTGNGRNNGIFKFDQLTEKEEFGISVASAGVYTLYVGQLQKNATDDKNIAEVEYKKGRTITVNPLDEDSMTFTHEYIQGNMKVNDDVAVLEKTVLENAGFEFNGVDTFTVTGRLLGKDGADNSNKPIKDAEVTLSSNKDNLQLVEETVTTDRNGEFDIEFSLDAEVNATITVTYGDLEYTIRVNAGSSELDTINTTKEGGYVLAGKDDNWSEEDSVLFSDAVQFELLDENGNVVEGNKLAGEPAEPAKPAELAEPAAVRGGKHDKYVTIKKPSNSTLEEDDLVLAWDDEEECYTLEYTGVKADAKKDLVEGEYTVTVALKSGSKATATFNVAKFGDVKDLAIKTYRGNGKLHEPVKNDDEIALGDEFGIIVKYVDENGIEINAINEDLKVGAEGKAIQKQLIDAGYTAAYMLKEDSTVNESLIGTTIKVTAFDSKEKKLATKELTVVDAYNTYGLAFDNNEGKVNVDNNVKVSIVDKNGKVAETVKGDVYAYVDSQSNKDAKVTVATDKNAAKGKFNITVYANQPTTADIVVGVRTSDAKIYAGTLTYTFGEESIPAGTSVVMTLGSTEMIVNNQLVDMKDAAPFAQDNRTFVPFRALGEALGAKVDYDQDAKTVTYKLGSSEIVMTLGSKDYTVNGVKKTMDVAPFAKDNRTYVPVRFVGEGLGFTVTGLTNANGQYVAVAFTK